MSADDCNCPPVTPCTLCDLDRRNNEWVEGADPITGKGGICLLDTMTEEQVIYVIERNPKARADLSKVTSNRHVLDLLRTVPMLSGINEEDELQKEFNKAADTIPFYSVFRGQVPYTGHGSG